MILKRLIVTGSDPKSDPSSNQKVATHTTNRNFTQKLLISRFVQNIITGIIQPINPPITVDVMGVQDVLSPCQTVILKESVKDAARSCTLIFRRAYGKVSWTSRENAMPWDIISDYNSRLISQGPSCVSNSVSPTRTGHQNIFSPSHPSISKSGRDAEPFNASINIFSAVDGHSTSYFSGVIGLEAVSGEFSKTMREKG